MSFRGRLQGFRPKYTAGARASVAGRSKIAALKAGIRRRNRAPRIKGAIASYGGRRELKYVDTASANYLLGSTGSVTCLNLLAVGDDNTTRDGRQVTIKSVACNGYVRPVDGNISDTMGRIILVWDNAVNSGTIATITDILAVSGARSFPNTNNENRFTILLDKKICMGARSDTATQTFNTSFPMPMSFYKKLNHVTQYSGTTAAIGSIQNGGLLLLTLGDRADDDCMQFSAAFRVRFTDN